MSKRRPQRPPLPGTSTGKGWEESDAYMRTKHDQAQREAPNDRGCRGCHAMTPRPLVETAWEMVVEQQHHSAEGWSMAKSWAWDHLREAVEPYLIRDADGDVIGFREPSDHASGADSLPA